jgi:hypothetical protein
MPTPSLLHVDASLTQLAVERGARSGRFLAPRIFTPVPVMKQSDVFFTIDPLGQTWRKIDDVRGPAGEPNTVDSDVDASRTYFARDHALRAFEAIEELANADAGAMPAVDKALFVWDVLRRNAEILAQGLIAANLTGGTLTDTPANKFDDYTNGDPIGYIRTQILAAQVRSGASPNVVAMDSAVLRLIAGHPDFLSRLTPTTVPQGYSGLDAMAAALAAMLGVDAVEYADLAFVNTAAQGQTPAYSRIWGDDVLIYRREPVRVGCNTFGVQFVWETGIPGVSQEGIVMQRFPAPSRSADEVQGHWFYDFQTLRAAASAQIPAFRITNSVAAF